MPLMCHEEPNEFSAAAMLCLLLNEYSVNDGCSHKDCVPIVQFLSSHIGLSHRCMVICIQSYKATCIIIGS